jgi:hypothetical protein
MIHYRAANQTEVKFAVSSQKDNYVNLLNILRKECMLGFAKGGWKLLISNSFWEEGLWLKPMCKENFRTDS